MAAEHEVPTGAMVNTFDEFLLWEATTRDVLDVKKCYIDVAGDVLAGIVLSEIVYWHLPDRKGETRLRVEKNGKMWIAVRRYEWWDRVRVHPRGADRALAILSKLGLIEKDVFKFYGEPTVHVRIVEDVFLREVSRIVSQPVSNPYVPDSRKREIEITGKGKTKSRKKPNPVTEITAENNLPTHVPETPPLTDEGKQEVIASANATMNAVLYQERAFQEHETYKNRTKFPAGILRDFADTYVKHTGQHPSSAKQVTYWLMVFNDWKDSGYTVKVLDIALRHAKKQNLTITVPSSLSAREGGIMAWVDGEIRKGNTFPDLQDKPAEGKYWRKVGGDPSAN